MGAVTHVEWDEDKARQITDQIRATASNLGVLIVLAHQHKAHKALGYSSWGAYCQAEFDMTANYSYRLIGNISVTRELEAAVADLIALPASTADEDPEVLPMGNTFDPTEPVPDDYEPSVELPERATRDLTAEDMDVIKGELADELEPGDSIEKAETAMQRAVRRRQAAKEAAKAPEGVDPETGEIAPEPQPEPPADPHPEFAIRDAWWSHTQRVRPVLKVDPIPVAAVMEGSDLDDMEQFAVDLKSWADRIIAAARAHRRPRAV